MQRPPRSPQASLLDRDARQHILWVGIVIAVIALGVGFVYYAPGDKTWQTMMFTTLAFTQIGHALGLRAAGEKLLDNLRANPAIIGVTVLTVLLQLAAVYVPFLDTFFQVVPLSAADFGICVALGGLVWGAVEIEKRLLRQRGASAVRQNRGDGR
jgi:Ca2+-transporting ATPase